MRKTAIVLNAIVVVFFTGFLASTFFARRHLDSLAREFVTAKTVDYAAPVVSVAEEALESPLVRKLLSDDHEAAIRREIASFHRAPGPYVADLTRQRPLGNGPAVAGNPLIEKVAAIKEKVRTFYDDTLDDLIVDLRIFSFSNLFFGAIALGVAWRSSSQISQPLVCASFLMFGAVLYCSYLYLDDFTFFRILLRTHLGWSYPALLCVVFGALWLDYGHARSEEGGEGLGGGSDA